MALLNQLKICCELLTLRPLQAKFLICAFIYDFPSMSSVVH
jgi:hypothetical protein